MKKGRQKTCNPEVGIEERRTNYVEESMRFEVDDETMWV